MAINIEFNGVDHTGKVALEGLRIQWRRNVRSTMEFTICKPGYVPVIGHKVLVWNGATPIFTGSIDEFQQYDAGDGSTVFYDCSVTGFEHRLDKRVENAVAFGPEFFTANSISDILTFDSGINLFSDGWAVQVKSNGTLPGGLSAGTTYYVVNATGSTCQLSATSGGGPINLSSAGSGDHWMLWHAGSILKAQLGYWAPFEDITLGTIRNGAVVDQASFEWFRIWDQVETLANLSGYIALVNGAGQVVFVPPGEYTAPFNITASSTDVLFGSVNFRHTREEYANSVYLRINEEAIALTQVTLTGNGTKRKFRTLTVIKDLAAVNGVTGTDIGIWGVDTGKQWYYTPGGYWIIQDSTGTPPASTFQATYRAAGFDARHAEDATEQSARAAVEAGSSGIYDTVLSDIGISNADAGDTAAAAALARLKEVPVEMSYRTLTDGVLPGQQQTVNLSSQYNVNDTFLVSQVDARFSQGVLVYSVQATSTSRLGGYLDVFRSFLGSGGSSAGGAAGGGSAITAGGDYYAVTLTADATISRTVGAAGTTLFLKIIQDSTGGWAATPSGDFEDTESPLDIRKEAGATTAFLFISNGTKWEPFGGAQTKA